MERIERANGRTLCSAPPWRILCLITTFMVDVGVLAAQPNATVAETDAFEVVSMDNPGRPEAKLKSRSGRRLRKLPERLRPRAAGAPEPREPFNVSTSFSGTKIRNPVLPASGHASGAPRVFFLFLTVTGIERPELWEAFFSGVDPAKYRTLMHCKDKHACDAKLADRNPTGITVVPSVPTLYCRDLVTAMWQLLGVAYSESRNASDRFVFVSESTLPVKPFHSVYGTLMGGTSDFCIFTKNHWVKLRLKGGASALIVKHSQWITLNREHAGLLVNGWPILKSQLKGYHWSVPVWLDVEKSWSRITSPGTVPLPMCIDEWAPFAAIYGAILDHGQWTVKNLPGFSSDPLAIRGFDSRHQTQGVCRTFAFWNVDDDLQTQELVKAVAPGLSCYPQCQGSHPAEFVSVTDHAALALAKSGFLFARKFTGQAMSLDQYKRIILRIEPPQIR